MSDIADEPRNDLLSGNLQRTIFFLSLPILCEQFLIFLVGFVDTYLAGGISAEATSATGLAAYVGWLASMLFALVGAGTTALVSRHWGAKEFEAANGIMNRSLLLGLLMGVVTWAGIYFAADWFATMLNMSNASHELTVRYLRLDSYGLLATSMTLVAAAAMRGSGNMRTPMLILGVVSVVNVIASAALVKGFGPIQPLGLNGIAYGTIFARYVGLALILLRLAFGASGLQLLINQCRLHGESTRRILRIGLPAAIDGGATWAGQFVFLMIIARLSADEMNSFEFAAHMIGVRVEGITYLPAIAWGLASSTMIGQSLGAQRTDIAVRSGYVAAIQCCLPVLIISVVFYIYAPEIFQLMHNEAEVHAIGIPAFRLLSFFQIPLILTIVFVFALRGAGDTTVPMWINAGSVALVRVPLAYYCGIILEGGLTGAWIGMCADVTIRGILYLIRFQRQKWTLISV